MYNKPKLTISLLVSNRIDTIQKCMASLRPFLEKLSCELIVVDTVGEEKSDGSLAVAKEYATKIVHFDWCNDFAAARNAGLKEASGEWFMFLDDDEWFEDVSEIIDFFTSGEYKKYNSATYQIRDYRDREGNYVLSTLGRMVKLEKETTFVGAVHEYLFPLYLPCKAFRSFVHHYGYVFDTEEDKKKHSERNLSILEPLFLENPKDIRVRLQLVQEYMTLLEHEEKAIKLCEETLQMEKEYHIRPEFQWILASKIRLMTRRKAHAEIVESIETLYKQFPVNKICQLALLVMELDARHSLQQYEEILEKAAVLSEIKEELCVHREKYERDFLADFELFLQDETLEKTMRQIINASNKVGNKESARRWTKKRTKLMCKPMLSISLLVSNRIDTIKKCMESLRPFLEELSCELIVVDTIGDENSDGSLAVAKEYATKVVHFDWCNDFAAARNAGLNLATGEWFMFLDDDEWFEDVNEIIEFFQTGEYLIYNSGTYQIRNYKDVAGSAYSTAVLGRMVKRSETLKFVGRIHETYSERKRPCKDFMSYVHHFGYVYNSEEEKATHRKRNEYLIRKELEDNPKDMRYRTQLAMELATYDNKGALDFCEETFALCPEQMKTKEFQWQLALVFCLYEALGKSAEEARKKYTELKSKYGYNETAENAICYQMIRICLIMNEPELAYPYAVKYFETLQILYNNEDIRQEQMAADFMRYQDTKAYLEMLHFGAYSAWQAKQYSVAWNWYESMPWEENGFENEEAFRFAVQLFLETGATERMLTIIKRVIKNQNFVGRENVKSQVALVLNEMKKQ